jgi:hypothetical protein
MREKNNRVIKIILFISVILSMFLLLITYNNYTTIRKLKAQKLEHREKVKALKEEIEEIKHASTLKILDVGKKHEDEIKQLKDEIKAKEKDLEILKEKNDNFDKANASLRKDIEQLKAEKKKIEEESLKVKQPEQQENVFTIN